MAILGFHFSGVYEEKLLDGEKTATVMEGSRHFEVGQKVQVYLSERENLFDGRKERRIGEATIQKVEAKRVGNLTKEEATNCGYEDLEELKGALRKWYDADEDSVVTYIKFDLELLE